MRRISILLAGILFAAGLGTSPALAQEAAADSPPSDGASVPELGEVAEDCIVGGLSAPNTVPWQELATSVEQRREVDVLIDEVPRHESSVEGGRDPMTVTVQGATAVSVTPVEGGTAIIGSVSFSKQTAGSRGARVEFTHSSICGEVVVEILDGGYGGWVTTGDSTFTLGEPWAVDQRGLSLDTWYEVGPKGDLAQVVVPASGSVSAVFDPVYTNASCVGYWTEGSAGLYLNPSLNDVAWCPPRGMIMSAPGNNYFPVWGNQPSIFNDFGLIMVRQNGDCSTFFTDTGPVWDFQVPCRAHDYCYDLRKAGLSGTVSDSECDLTLLALMLADCNDRNFLTRPVCEDVANTAFLAVSAPFVVTNPNPGVVTIRNKRNGKCSEVEQGAAANNTPIQQWNCRNLQRERYRIWPAEDHPGYFQLFPEHVSGKCARVWGGDPVLFGCSNVGSKEFKIQPALNQDQYSLRSKYAPSRCWKVPVSFVNGVDLDAPTCNDSNTWYIWRIVRVT